MAQVKNKFILSVDESTVKLNNDSFLSARNNADSADISMFKVNASDNIEAGAILDMGSFALITASTVDGIDIAAKAGDTDLNTTHRSSDGSDHSKVGTNETNISNLTAVTGSATLAAINYSTNNYVADASALETAIGALDTQVKTNADSIGGVSSALLFKGAFDASALGTQLDDGVNGDYWIVTVAGTILTVPFSVGDHLVIVDDAYTGTPTLASEISKVDNTEAADILRTADLTSTQIYVGSAGNLAAPVFTSGDCTISNTGSFTISANAVEDSMLATIWLHENITLLAGDITAQFVDLSDPMIEQQSVFLFVDGVFQVNGEDYSISLTGGAGGVGRVSFLNDLGTAGASELIAGDKLRIKYRK